MNAEGKLTIKNGNLIKCNRNATGNIVIPNSVTRICEFAFGYCHGLTSVTIPDSVTHIGEDAFRGCISLTAVTIPDSVTHIGVDAFCGCISLTDVTIPDSVTYIGRNVFYGCSGLTSITIPNSVTSIGQFAFYDCLGLTSVIIPNSVAYIGAKAFSGCEKLLNKLTEQGVYYKAFNANMTCMDYQYNFGINRFYDEPIMYKQGFHYCDNPLSIFDYYSGADGEDIIICKVKPMGTIIKGDNHKHVCNVIEVLERVTFEDIFEQLKK